jgi:hypothetical protein
LLGVPHPFSLCYIFPLPFSRSLSHHNHAKPIHHVCPAKDPPSWSDRSVGNHNIYRPSATADDGFSAHKQWEALSEIGDLIKPQSTNRKDFIEECQSGRLNGVVAAFRTFPSVSITGLFDEELVSSLPKSWRFLAQNGMLWFVAPGFEVKKRNNRVIGIFCFVD